MNNNPYAGVLGTPRLSQTLTPQMVKLQQKYNPEFKGHWGLAHPYETFKLFRSKYDQEQNKALNFEYGDKAVAEYYAPTCRNCKLGACGCSNKGPAHRSLAMDDPYNSYSYLNTHSPNQ